MPKSPGDTDIFDRSFKKIIGSLSSKALIQFINSMFGADHPLDSEVKRLNTEKMLDHSVEELVEQGFTPLLPFYIVKLRKAAKRAKTDEEKAKVEEGFKALGLKLKEAIEQGADREGFSEEDIVTLLERLAYIVNHIGEGYRTTEVNEMLRNSTKGFGVVLLERGERRGELKAARNALKLGLSIEQVAQITEIPTDKLLKQLNKPEKK